MELLFKKIAQLSASLVFVILAATTVVLYLSAKPAIQEFGAGFFFESRWAVEEKVELSPAELSELELLEADKSTFISDDFIEDEDDFIMDDEDFITDDDMESDSNESRIVYGALVPIVGTIFSTLIAMLFSLPIAMGIAVFLSEIAPSALAKPVGVAIELLASIPSIIYGMWGLFYFGPFIADLFGGNTVSLLVAGLVLGIMVIPFMAALSRDAITTVPDMLKESAYAMGATKLEVIKDVVFPYAKSGIIGSIILSFGRALGETMAVAFVIGGVYQFAGKITDPTNSIPVVLANSFAESSGLSLSVLFYLALILFVLSFAVIAIAKLYFLRGK
ncbi:MAG: phosphate ABC transporter permease subunit PstC [Cycloclasticus sp.]|jgi:phosphate transport system permease protein|nr:MAG: phosphate ABC transporter permease [Cycloclasticus sp. Phe_18]MBV1912201.1 phosphate ABC transporter permease subunit PstC [Cycloclasticus sp.]MDF1689025.1 phosphate ABC transporter permease subunit PstC [Cycloclasticus sp.]MEE4291650.1 phosphate ABC transporter permease subunit PstC [Cycloclasticus sp.]